MKPFSNKDDQTMKDALFSDLHMDADFTRRVLDKLDNVQMVNDKEKLPNLNAYASAKRRWRKLKWMGGAAAAVIVFGSALTLWQQPELRDKVSGVFKTYKTKPTIPEETVPPGMKDWFWYNDYERSRPLGLLVKPEVKAEDQGYAIQIEHVLIDRSRIVISARQTAPDGSVLQSPLRETDDFRITDLEGNEVAKRVPVTLNSYPGIEEYAYVFTGHVPDVVMVTSEIGEIERFTATMPDRKPVKVNWHFQFKLDTRKAKQLSAEKQIDKHYTSPDGLELDFKKIIRTPSGIRLDYAASLGEKLKRQSSDADAEHLKIFYHLETVDGEGKRGRYDFGKPGVFEPLIQSERADSHNEGTKEFINIIHPLAMPPESKNIRFVLDGFYMPVHVKESISMKPAELSAKPAVFHGSGDELAFSAYKLGSYDSKGGQVLILTANGTYVNQEMNEKWIAIDEKGREYPVFVGHGSAPDGDKKIIHDSEFRIDGMDHVPSRLTLTRTVVNRVFKDVDWSVDLWDDTQLPWENMLGK